MSSDGVMARALKIAAAKQYGLGSAVAVDVVGGCLRIQVCTKTSSFEPARILENNADYFGVELDAEHGKLHFVVTHVLPEGASVDDDELHFMCARLKNALDIHAQECGRTADEIVLAE